jgi:hypothetical protein
MQFLQEVTFLRWNGAISFQTIDLGIGDCMGYGSGLRDVV